MTLTSSYFFQRRASQQLTPLPFQRIALLSTLQLLFSALSLAGGQLDCGVHMAAHYNCVEMADHDHTQAVYLSQSISRWALDTMVALLAIEDMRRSRSVRSSAVVPTSESGDSGLQQHDRLYE